MDRNEEVVMPDSKVFVSSALTVTNISAVVGRGYVANRHISAGELLLQEEGFLRSATVAKLALKIVDKPKWNHLCHEGVF